MEETLVRVKEKNRRKKTRRKIFYFLMAAVIVVLFAVIAMEKFFIINQITVVGSEGSFRYTSEEIIEKSGIEPGENLIKADLETARKKLLSEFPYFDEVLFEKKYPFGLAIIPSEQFGVMYLGIGEEYFILSESGRALEIVEDPAYDGQHRILVVTNNVKRCVCGENVRFREPETLSMMETLYDAIIKNDIFEKVVWISVDDQFDLSLNYDGRFEVSLGTYEHMVYKTALFVKVIEDKLYPADTGKIDVTNTAEAIVKLNNKLS